MVGKYLSCKMRYAGDVANRQERGAGTCNFLMSNTSDKFLCYAVWYCSPRIWVTPLLVGVNFPVPEFQPSIAKQVLTYAPTRVKLRGNSLACGGNFLFVRFSSAVL